MIDFSAYECTKGMYLYCFLLYEVIALLYWKKCTNKDTQIKSNLCQFTLILIYTLTSFYNGDFWHYQEFILTEGESTWGISEEIYSYLAEFVNYNYLLFRCFVWGGGLLILVYIFKRYSLNIGSTMYFFFVMYISIYDYARVSLALVVLFLGYNLLTYEPQEKYKTILLHSIGCILIISSFFLHHSLLPIILFAFISLIPFNITKTSLIALFILFPLATNIASSLFFNFIGLDADLLSNIIQKLDTYSEFESESVSLLEKIRLVWSFALLYVPFFIITYVMCIKNSLKQYASNLQKLYKLLFFMMILATSALCLNLQNLILFYRYLNLTFLPITILFCSLHENNDISTTTYKKILFAGILYPMFRHGKVLLRWQGSIS